ncbi:MAG: hypothetical protein IJJ73_09300 [Bacteroidaceae bacterium]|nr:hypothetical protein [Bacteroidaceae bacterium]
MNDITNWLQGHVWLCTYIIAGLAIMTFVLNFILKKQNAGKNHSQKANKITNSTIYQAGRDVIISKNEVIEANREQVEPYIGVSIETNNIFRKFIGYGASCGEVIQAGNYKADYEVEIELNVTIQNESLYTAYKLDVSYTPNHYSKNYIIIDSRQNKLQPLEGNKHVEFKLRIIKCYNDVYASDIDNETQKIGKEMSPLNGSVLNIRYQDSKHKEHLITEILK